MKRSKLFLGTTTAILAVAGVAAAKYYGPATQRFYITNEFASPQYCKQVIETCTDKGNVQCFHTVIIGSSIQRYVLYSQGPEGLKSAANCISLLKRSVEL